MWKFVMFDAIILATSLLLKGPATLRPDEFTIIQCPIRMPSFLAVIRQVVIAGAGFEPTTFGL